MRSPARSGRLSQASRVAVRQSGVCSGVLLHVLGFRRVASVVSVGWRRWDSRFANKAHEPTPRSPSEQIVASQRRGSALTFCKEMKTLDANEDSAVAPSVIAILCGGGAIAWMLWMNGVEIFTRWFFYPSFAFLALICATLFVGLRSRFSRITWTICMWWSGLWSLVFMFAFAAPPFSTIIVGSLVAPIIEAGRISPFLAGFLHILIWACAKDVLNLTNKQQAEQGGGADAEPAV